MATCISGYAGKINHKGNQKVDAVYRDKKAAKSPKVITGGDLRAKKSHK